MKELKSIASDKIKNGIDDIIHDRKTVIKILTVVLILLAAAVLKIHGANNSAVTVEAADPAAAEESSEDADDSSEGKSDIIFVDIGGAVVSPGVYQVSSGTRLFEVVEMAGGLSSEADTDSVNQASFVEDGQKIIIPAQGDDPSAEEGSLSDAGSAGAKLSGSLININTAPLEELTTLNGIGEVMAGRIIEYRSSNRFQKPEDIMSVKGIGTGIFEKIKDDITC